VQLAGDDLQGLAVEREVIAVDTDVMGWSRNILCGRDWRD
jgi:hypothetical protein